MSQSVIVPTVFSAGLDFVSGRAPRLYVRMAFNDDVVEAWCMWLNRHGYTEAAETLLEDYCAGKLRVH